MPYFEPNIDYIRNLHPRGLYHHWCPRSEAFASTSQLASAILCGWQVSTLVIRKTITYGARGTRHMNLYYTELRRNGEYMTMPVVESPSMLRLLCSQPFEVVNYREQRDQKQTPVTAIA